jgi:chromosomal replication initiator protein
VTDPENDVLDFWHNAKSHLTTDSRITPQLWGFLDLVEPRGVMGGVLYLEVPNELTRGMLEQRVRLPLLAALENIEDSDISSFAIVVNPEIQSDVLQIPADDLLR